MQEIPKTHLVVDRRTCEEIEDAVAADPDTGYVMIRRLTYTSEVLDPVYYPGGIRIVSRR